MSYRVIVEGNKGSIKSGKIKSKRKAILLCDEVRELFNLFAHVKKRKKLIHINYPEMAFRWN